MTYRLWKKGGFVEVSEAEWEAAFPEPTSIVMTLRLSDQQRVEESSMLGNWEGAKEEEKTGEGAYQGGKRVCKWR